MLSVSSVVKKTPARPFLRSSPTRCARSGSGVAVGNSETRRVTSDEAGGGVLAWYEFLRRSIGVLTIASLFALVFIFLFYAIHVLLLVICGVLLAIFLRSLADWVSHFTRLKNGWALLVVVAGLVALSAGVSWLLTPQIAAQTQILVQTIPESLNRLRDYLADTTWGSLLLQQVPDLKNLQPSMSKLWSQTVGALSTVLSVVTQTLIVVVVGLYLAVEPGIYLQGLVRLTPPERRERSWLVLAELNKTLRWWLVGRFLSMFIIGIFSGIGFWLLGVPLALTLGILAGLFTFIPNIGPILSAIPAVLLALIDSPIKALYVIILIVVVQTVETYAVTPVVQQRTISLPPALVLTAQVLMGLTLGLLGLFLATPITAMIVVLINRIYLEGVLRDREAASGA